MVVQLTLRTDAEGQVLPSVDGQALAGPTALADLPSLTTLQADPLKAWPFSSAWACPRRRRCGV